MTVLSAEGIRQAIRPAVEAALEGGRVEVPAEVLEGDSIGEVGHAVVERLDVVTRALQALAQPHLAGTGEAGDRFLLKPRRELGHRVDLADQIGHREAAGYSRYGKHGSQGGAAAHLAEPGPDCDPTIGGLG